ncbi:MAG: hypothetical protein WC410_02645 [Candidatus Paceibacterota bacterium]
MKTLSENYPYKVNFSSPKIRRERVTKLLETIRKNPKNCELLLAEMFRYLSEHNLTLADIGTKEEEIENLKKTGFRLRAEEILRSIRKERKPSLQTCHDLLLNIIRSKTTLKELGTSKNELLKFEKRSCYRLTWWLRTKYQTRWPEQHRQLRVS